MEILCSLCSWLMRSVWFGVCWCLYSKSVQCCHEPTCHPKSSEILRLYGLLGCRVGDLFIVLCPRFLVSLVYLLCHFLEYHVTDGDFVSFVLEVRLYTCNAVTQRTWQIEKTTL